MDSKRRELADKNAIHESKSLNGELCSFENNVVEKMDSLGDDSTCGGRVLSPKEECVEILRFTHFSKVFRFSKIGNYERKKDIFHEIKVSVVIKLV